MKSTVSEKSLLKSLPANSGGEGSDSSWFPWTVDKNTGASFKLILGWDSGHSVRHCVMSRTSVLPNSPWTLSVGGASEAGRTPTHMSVGMIRLLA